MFVFLSETAQTLSISKHDEHQTKYDTKRDITLIMMCRKNYARESTFDKSERQASIDISSQHT